MPLLALVLYAAAGKTLENCIKIHQALENVLKMTRKCEETNVEKEKEMFRELTLFCTPKF